MERCSHLALMKILAGRGVPKINFTKVDEENAQWVRIYIDFCLTNGNKWTVYQ